MYSDTHTRPDDCTGLSGRPHLLKAEAEAVFRLDSLNKGGTGLGEGSY